MSQTTDVPPAKRAILDWVEQHRADVISLTQALVRFPSEQKPPNGNERDCQLFVADFLKDLGCQVDLFTPAEVKELAAHPQFLPGRDYADRPNVVGVLHGTGGSQHSLLFSGHIDVVPTYGQGKYGWWDGTLHEGKLYGRGSNDMKGGIAAYLTAARCIKELGLALKGKLILESVVDEEFGGANGTLACRLRGYDADVAIVPEPNNLLVSTGHRGGQQFRLYVTSQAAGMGFGETVLSDPITSLGHILVALERYNQERNARPRPAGFENEVFPLMPFILRAGELLPWGTQDAIPDSAWLEFWIEIPPGVTQPQLLAELQDAVAQASAVTPALQRVTTRWEKRTRFLPGTSISADQPAIRTLAANLELVTGQPASYRPAPFACDAFMFNLCSPTPCVLLGPRGGNAHAPDEWVEVEDLITLTKTFALTIVDWLM
jgi:acetylornithine deacetylase